MEQSVLDTEEGGLTMDERSRKRLWEDFFFIALRDVSNTVDVSIAAALADEMLKEHDKRWD